jgi:hypothetical protein
MLVDQCFITIQNNLINQIVAKLQQSLFNQSELNLNLAVIRNITLITKQLG